MRISDWSSDVCSSDLCWTMKSSSGNSSGAEALFERLSPRQRECLRRVYLRSTSKEIATALDLGPGTVDTYLTEAILTLKARNRRHAPTLVHDIEETAATPRTVDIEKEGLVDTRP